MAFNPISAAETAPAEDDAPAIDDPIGLILSEQIQDQLWMAAATEPRSLQATIGPSEVGTTCERQLAYKIRGDRRINRADPLRVMIGSGMHADLEAKFRRIDGGSDRFLIEHRTGYRGVTGTVDLYDTRRQAVIDWKSSTKAKIRDIRRRGPQAKYKTQAHIYGAALASEGWPVRTVALVFVPLDGALTDIYVWTEPLDQSVADAAIDRLDRIRADLERADTNVSGISPEPSKLCPWCDHHRPGSTDPERGCPGLDTPTKEK